MAARRHLNSLHKIDRTKIDLFKQQIPRIKSKTHKSHFCQRMSYETKTKIYRNKNKIGNSSVGGGDKTNLVICCCIINKITGWRWWRWHQRYFSFFDFNKSWRRQIRSVVFIDIRMKLDRLAIAAIEKRENHINYIVCIDKMVRDVIKCVCVLLQQRHPKITGVWPFSIHTQSHCWWARWRKQWSDWMRGYCQNTHTHTLIIAFRWLARVRKAAEGIFFFRSKNNEYCYY